MAKLYSVGLLCVLALAYGAEIPTTTQSAGHSTPLPGATPKSEEAARLEIKAQLHALSENCKAKSQISPEEAQIMVNQQVPKTEQEKCYLECIYNGMGLAKDGQFNEKGARLLAQKRFANAAEELSKANLMIETCTKEAVVKDTNEKCAVGRVIRECFVKNGAKINFFPKA